VTAGGTPGAAMALRIFRREIDISMAQMAPPRSPISGRSA
jgi:(S)-mandelate dehydrogenase